ncbi:MAG: sugar phosphate nucleotidyltransferase [Oscillospiraceae bacterium]|nr:sugar phosphate nucleotidyltransferase [Oscillospiraceae bacterium]
MKAIIMAGGEGTRLRPLTCGVPKPLTKLCGRPVVHYILDLLQINGFDEAIFTLGYKAEQIERLFESGRYGNVGLRFSREDSPLGTAGCVKKVFTDILQKSDPESDFVVISGDALCDFDLKSAYEYHKSVNAAATVLTKRVDDPREYGLVISERDKFGNGRVSGFSEKPSYLGCICDCANTGVYILSPKVMELIPGKPRNSGQICDFARDVFPKMLESDMPLHAYEASGYWCDIGDFSTYAASQFDILTGKVRCRIDGLKVADGVYSQSRIPSGLKLTAPCYIGKNVSFGENTVINSCIIGDNVNVGNNVKLKDSVFAESVFISDGVTANGAVVCAGTKLLHAASVYEGSVIGEGCLIGREAIVRAGVKVWNEKSVPSGANVTRNIKYGGKSGVELTETGIHGETNADITPELCTAVGAALSSVDSRVAVSCKSDAASEAMKHAVMSGISAGGGDVFDVGNATLPQLIYTAKMLDCGAISHIKCGIFAQIDILGRAGGSLTRFEERRFESAFARGEFKNADWSGFGKICAVSGSGFGAEELYTSMLTSRAKFKSGYKIKLDSEIPLYNKVFDRVSGNGEVLVVTLTEGGVCAEFHTEKGEKVPHEQLVLLAAAAVMQSGSDVALPHDSALPADFIAESCGRKVHRFFRCSNDSGDEYARELAGVQGFLKDGAVLALTVLEYLAKNSLTIENAVKSVPKLAVKQREVEINCPPQRIISKLCESGACGKGEGVLMGENRQNIIIRSSKRGDSLFLLAECLSSETADELCDSTEKLIRKLLSENT